MALFAAGQTLLIDADDTLWENNIYFERAIASFIAFLDHREYTPAEIRATLNDCERETILERGYGLSSFRLSLENCYRRLRASELSEAQRRQIGQFADAIGTAEIELLPGVETTLQELAGRHRLILMTKGNHAEQADKFSRSGLQSYFSAVEIVAEKDPAAYSAVLARHGLSVAVRPHGVWMIGNSPKSDINPALAAGLNAVHLFHKDTWVLEHAALSAPASGLQLFEREGFASLLELF